ncbi:hypothetical protein SAMN06296241_3196 [Salinimicrobium sediminis]|uniref:Uncharacterized protein n=2 Tax=Salinimicrobium sediminis TaxID=1343891 RepID=A0A285X8I9_9FLAO|nr:hypothetical protein SAMN06296241_3196 [Salinimicrobium sediminis]
MSIDLHCQNAGDRLKVESIYDALQDRGTSSKDVAGQMPFINWKDAEHLEQATKKHSITLAEQTETALIFISKK